MSLSSKHRTILCSTAEVFGLVCVILGSLVSWLTSQYEYNVTYKGNSMILREDYYYDKVVAKQTVPQYGVTTFTTIEYKNDRNQ